MTAKKKFAAIGECMIELNETADGHLAQTFGGDTLNTCLYVARLGRNCGIEAAYFTALGDDPYSDAMRQAWQAEGIDTNDVAILPGKLPGLYAIKTDADGERSFYYWRDQAAAKQLLRQPGWQESAARLQRFDLIYLSGISVSILDQQDRQALLESLTAARQQGSRIAFDINYRPRGWRNAEAAATALSPFMALSDILLPGLEDVAALFETTTIEDTMSKLASFGASQICLKDGEKGVYIYDNVQTHHQAALPTGPATDTTAAGDSFNAGYLCAILSGASPLDAAEAGARLAGRVVCHKGAIIPIDAMADLG